MVDVEFLRRSGGHLYDRSLSLARRVRTTNIVPPVLSKVKRSWAKSGQTKSPTEPKPSDRICSTHLPPKRKLTNKNSHEVTNRSESAQSKPWRQGVNMRNGRLSSWAQRSRRHLVTLSQHITQKQIPSQDTNDDDVSDNTSTRSLDREDQSNDSSTVNCVQA